MRLPSEVFGDINGATVESTPLSPRSPSAVAKATVFWEVANCPEADSLLVREFYLVTIGSTKLVK